MTASDDKTSLIRRLTKWDVDAMTLHPGGSNYVFVVRLKAPKEKLLDGQEESLLAIYKPAAGERPLHDFPYGSLHRRERAAYVVSEALGWPLLPPVVVRDGPHGIGSFQLFIRHDARQNYFTMRESCLPLFGAVAAFDTLVHNVDRKGGSVLKADDGKVWAIDNALTFNPLARRRTVMLEFWGEPYPPGTVRAVRGLLEKLKEKQPLRIELESLLDETEIMALIERAEDMVAKGVHPRLHPEINVPWPFV